MSEQIHTFAALVTDAWGLRYRVRVEGSASRNGNWEGWLVFEPELGVGPALHTGRETTQPDRRALAYWATGLEPAYLEGALARARER